MSCQLHQHVPSEAPLHPWEWPAKPWSRLHIDHEGPFLGAHFLILIDSHSKWMEVEKVSSTATEPTIHALRRIFATHGIPDAIVSDNGSAFTSHEFAMFCKANGIRHIRSAPRHPSTHGLAERAVEVFKSCVTKMDGGLPLEVRVTRFLARYRITPQTTTGRAPAELLMNRIPKTHLDLLCGSLESRVLGKQDSQKKYDCGKKLRVF